MRRHALRSGAPYETRNWPWVFCSLRPMKPNLSANPAWLGHGDRERLISLTTEVDPVPGAENPTFYVAEFLEPTF